MADYYAEVGGDSTVIRDFESTGRMQIEFSRSPESFAINRYSELRPVTLAEGYYLKIDPAQGARILYNDDREHVWLDLADRPTGTDNQLQFIMATYKTLRRAYSVPLSDRAVGMSAWPVAETEMRQKAQQAMTARTIRALRTAITGFTGTTNTAAASSGTFVNTTGSGKWNAGTVANPNIQICLQTALNLILKGTTGVVDPSDLVLVLNPQDAMAMSQSAEIKSMLQSSVYAYPQITGQMPGFPSGRQMNYGLPPMLYDFRIAVEKTVQVAAPKTVASSAIDPTATTTVYAIPQGTALLLARKDNTQVNPAYLKAESEGRKISDEEGRKIPIYSSLVGFFKEEFTTEILADPKNRRTLVSIVTDFDYQLTTPASGFMFTAIT